MTYPNPLNRSGLAAIAAVLALSSTPLLAQDATSTPDPLAATPADEAPADAAVSTAPTADPLAPADPAATTATTTRTTTTRTTTARRAVRTARPVAAATATAPRAAAAPVPAAEPTSDLAEAAPVAPLAVAPPAAPVEAAPVPIEPSASVIDDAMLPIAGAAGLGLLALAGAGIAMRRRKLRRDEIVTQDWHEPAFEAPAAVPAPATAAAITPVAASIAPRREAPRSAFAWDSAAAHRPVARHDPVDAPAGSRVEAAYRGPTADNPSLSLKRRLKRAAFFDQRERLVAAGEAAPIARDAGLPDAVAARRPAAQRQQRTLQPA